MTTLQFVAGWALRSSGLILMGALLLWALRVKDPSIRLAAWVAMLCGSLAIPALTAALPKLPMAVLRAAARPGAAPIVVNGSGPTPIRPASRPNGGLAKRQEDRASRFDGKPAAAILYVLVAGALLLRLCVGLALSLRLLGGSRAAGRTTEEGIEILESDRVTAPVSLGIVRPAIVLPGDWRQWDGAKLDAVLAHERSHIRRRDPVVQLLSAIHRALLWHSPLSWFLHQRIVRVAEEASDDAAVAATRDRAAYAAVLLDFMQRRARGSIRLGVPMARYGRADQRIHRVLDGTALSRGVSRWSVAAILALGAPLAYVAAAARPQNAAPPAVQSTSPQLQVLLAAPPGRTPPSQAATSTADQGAGRPQSPSQAPPVDTAAQAAPAQASKAAQLNYESGTDGYLMHRGTNDRDMTAYMDAGGVDLQEKSYEIRRRIRNFVLFHRHEKTYFIEDPDAVRRAWKELDDQDACRALVEAATPFAEELQKALAACKISDAEITAARKLKETQGAPMERKNVIEIVTGSRLWSALDLSVMTGAARPIQP